MRTALIALILVACSCHTAGKKFRWCCVSDREQRKCADLARALAAVLPAAAVAAFAKLSCILAPSTADCIGKIQANRADAVTLDAGEVYTAAKQFGLIAVAKEMYEDGGCVLAVALVRNSSLSIRSLQGTRSCHSGARWTAGWSLPLGFLLSRNYLPWAEEQPLSQAVSSFFNSSCIPGASAMAPSLCALCQGRKSYVQHRNSFCETSDNEPFYNTQGALRCLRSGTGDVAFLDHMAISNIDESERGAYRLLCTDGSVAPLGEVRRCSLGRGPGSAVVTRTNYRRVARKFLTAAQVLFGHRGRERRRFQLFESRAYGAADLLFHDATERLQVLPENTEVSRVLGLDYMALLKGLGHEGSSLEDSVVRWCCISAAEQQKCEQWALSIRSDPLVCVRVASMRQCVEKIKQDEADAVSLDATHAYIAGKCGLVPVATEYYGEECVPAAGGAKGAAYFESEVLPSAYAVAVVRRSSRSLSFGSLAGRRSCHSHMYSPAGWLLPANHMLQAEPNATRSCDINTVYRELFWKGCLPGSKGNLCKVCVGGEEETGAKPTNQRCVDNHNERYYGNMGALRCLVGDPSGRSYGDVAFLEQHSLEDNIQTLESSGWAEGWTSWDFELLCPDGQRAPLSQWQGCHLGAIPPNIVMTRPVLTSRVYDFLMKSQETLAAHLGSDFQLFESESYGEHDLLFKDQTRCLVHATHLNYRTILGQQFYQLAEAAFNCTQSDVLEFCAQDVCSVY
ncbi:saxiphilin-like [Lepisosteus oculatus]|uniref:saxiphilin-like n=1 Tax=Lepisosteus oculatus TaxID=7918 RepID=UPI0035F52CAF